MRGSTWLKKMAYDASFMTDMEFEIEIRKIAERLGVFDDFRREIKRLQEKVTTT